MRSALHLLVTLKKPLPRLAHASGLGTLPAPRGGVGEGLAFSAKGTLIIDESGPPPL